MPRNRRLRLLANLVRGLGFGGVLLALATALVWYLAPARVDQLEAALRGALVDGTTTAWAEAGAETEPARRRDRFAALALRLSGAGREDRFAPMMRACHLELSLAAERAGDLATATEWMRQAVRFDDRDLPAAVRHATLLCQGEGTLDQGLTVLREFAARFPANERAVTALVEQLRTLGLEREVRPLLARAIGQPRPRQWTVHIDDGAPLLLRPTRAPDGSELVLRLEPGAHELRFEPPDNGTVHTSARLTTATIDLSQRPTQGAFVFTVPPHDAARDVRFVADTDPRLPRWLARLALEGREAFATVDGTRIRAILRRPEFTDRDFEITFPLGRPTAEVKVELPRIEGLRYRIHGCEFEADDRAEAAGRWPGEGPTFTFPVGLEGPIVALHLEGVVW